MADSGEQNELESKFVPQNDGQRAHNDPWAVFLDESIPALPSLPNDPLREQISSEKYLESLEKKLCRLKGRTNKEAKASEMIVSLQRTKEDQLNQILSASSQIVDLDDEIDYQENTMMSALQRKINPDRQALNPVELFPLINNDFLAKMNELTDEDKRDNSPSDKTLKEESVQS